MSDPEIRYRKLKEIAEMTGISVSTLRQEIKEGYLRAIRARESCSAPLLVSDAELTRWLDDHAGQRTYVPAPSDVHRERL